MKELKFSQMSVRKKIKIKVVNLETMTIVEDMKDEHPECEGCSVFESIIKHILAGEKNYTSMDCEDCDAVKEKQ